MSLAARQHVEEGLGRVGGRAAACGVIRLSARGGGGEGVGVQVEVRAGRRCLNSADQVDRVALEHLRPVDVEPPALLEEARPPAACASAARPGQEARQAVRRFLACSASSLAQKVRVSAPDLLGDQEVAPHEALDRRGVAAVAIAHAPGDLRLQVEGQPLLGPAGGEVQVAAHRPQEVEGAQEGPHLARGRTPPAARSRDGVSAGCRYWAIQNRVFRSRSAALALLDVGLDQVAARRRPGRGARRAPSAWRRRTRRRCRRPPRLRKRRISSAASFSSPVSAPRLEQRGADGEVLARRASCTPRSCARRGRP